MNDHGGLVVKESGLGRLEPLGKGGTAFVYRAPDVRIPGMASVVYKQYKPKTRAKAGPALLPALLSLVQFHAEKLQDEQRRQWDDRIVWPLRVVVNDAGAATGILMRLIPGNYFHSYVSRTGNQHTRPREIDTLFGSTHDMGNIGMGEVSRQERLRVIAQIARTYGMMHFAEIIIGDISARNIIYDVAGSPSVLVVDADSARLKGTRSAFSDQPHTPYWEPPEALRAKRLLQQRGRPAGEVARLQTDYATQNKETDVFKFGLMVVRILDHGRGRAVNRDPRNAERILRQTVSPAAAELLVRTLGPDGKQRPTMRDWHEVLSGRTPRSSSSGPPPSSSSSPTPAASRPPSVVADGTVSGGWVFVEGTGWVRRTSGAS